MLVLAGNISYHITVDKEKILLKNAIELSFDDNHLQVNQT